MEHRARGVVAGVLIVVGVLLLAAAIALLALTSGAPWPQKLCHTAALMVGFALIWTGGTNVPRSESADAE